MQRRAVRRRTTSLAALTVAVMSTVSCADEEPPRPSTDAPPVEDGAAEEDAPSADDARPTARRTPPLSPRPWQQPADGLAPEQEEPDAAEAGDEPDPGEEEPTAPGPSDELELEHVTTIRGEISPKSVVASDTGVYIAQNMMYRHTITVYDDDHELVATIPDRVDLEEFGLEGPGEPVRGAPVEADFTPDGTHAYVSNYSMYGPGFSRQGSDSCGPDDGIDESFVYRIDVDALEIDQVIPVGAVPKVVKVTPDGRYVLVTNWCSYDLSIIDAERGEEVERIEIGRYPRGIAIDEDSTSAYVAVMGSSDVAVVDLTTIGADEVTIDWLRDVGRGPRDLALGADGRYLFVTLNREGVLARVDLDGEHETEKVATGEAPRSMAMAADGRSLYLVNYHSDTVSKVATDDLEVLQEIPVDDKPIGITYDDRTGEVWVACYSGSIIVFQDAEPDA